MRLARRRRRGYISRTNRPKRFVRNYHPPKLLRRKRPHAAAEFLRNEISRILLFKFPDAHNRCKPSLKRRKSFLRHDFIRFAEILAALTMPHNHIRTTRRAYHRTRNFARIRALLRPVQILRANLYLRSARGSDRGFDVYQRRAKHNLTMRRPLDQTSERFAKSHSLGRVFVHLPISGNKRQAHS